MEANYFSLAPRIGFLHGVTLEGTAARVIGGALRAVLGGVLAAVFAYLLDVVCTALAAGLTLTSPAIRLQPVGLAGVPIEIRPHLFDFALRAPLHDSTSSGNP